MNPSSTASYSLQWSLGVVKQLEEKYARATKITYKILAINTKTMALYLSKHDPLFPKLRDFVKIVDKIDVYASPSYRMSEYSSLLSKFSSKFIDERLKGRLTAVQSELMLEEQWMKGGNPEPKVKDSFLSSSIFPEVVDDGYGPQLCFRFDQTESVGA